MSDRRTEHITAVTTEAIVEQIDTLADDGGVSRSATAHRLLALALDSTEINAEAETAAQEIKRRREKYVERGTAMDMVSPAGFRARMANAVEGRFEAGFDPDRLEERLATWYGEAEELEQVAAKYDDLPDLDDGELVEQVDRELARALEATRLSSFDPADHYADYQGVSEGEEALAHYHGAVRGAMEKLLRLREAFENPSHARLTADNLPRGIEDDLPPGVGRDDVAEAATDLVAQGVDPEQAADRLASRIEPDEAADQGNPTIAGPADRGAGPGIHVPASADGGEPTAEPDSMTTTTDTTTTDAPTDDQPAVDPLPTRGELVDRAAEWLARGDDSKHRREAHNAVTDGDGRTAIQRNGWTADAILADAQEVADDE